MASSVNMSKRTEKRDGPRSGVTSKRAAANDLERVLAYPMCVSNSGLWWHMAQTVVYVVDCVSEKKALQLDRILNVRVRYSLYLQLKGKSLRD